MPTVCAKPVDLRYGGDLPEAEAQLPVEDAGHTSEQRISQLKDEDKDQNEGPAFASGEGLQG